MKKYKVRGTIETVGEVIIEADSAEEAVEEFSYMTADDLDRDGEITQESSEADWVYELKDDKWELTDEDY